MAKVITVFMNNYQLNPAGIQLLVGFTTFLMLLRFVLDAYRYRTNSWIMRMALLMLDSATYAQLHYSLGVMQRPSVENSYYKVWAVLLVTLRYSVKHGRPAGIALRQTPLVDLMSSFWAAHILRSNAVLILKIPVWLLWSINSARIIHGFVSSEHATTSHKDNVRLVAEYMRREHQSSVESDPATMKGYRYLVLGEAKQQKVAQPPCYRLELKLTQKEKLITLDNIWRWEEGNGSPQGSRVSAVLKSQNGKLRDLCLSFALYKLLRRRFYNLPIYESKLEKTKQLVFDGILGCRNTQSTHEGSGAAAESADLASREEADRHKWVFRVTKAELSFLNDFFYSRHALIFADGFPFLRLFLSTLLVGAISYMAVAIHQYSKIATLDELGRVHHGVIFTWILLSFLGVKEIIEIVGYVFSDWTKVLLLCNYARQPWWLRGCVMEKVVTLLCRYSLVPGWHGRIGQYNLIFGVGQRSTFAFTDLQEDVQKELLVSLRSLRNPSKMPCYLDEAFSGSILPKADNLGFRNNVNRKMEAFKEDVHKILLWHIATCYCELHLAEKRSIGVRRPWWVKIPPLEMFTNRSAGIWTGPFVEESKITDIGKEYITAMRLSQYCAHALRLSSPLIPGNDIVTAAVLDQVIKEIRKALRRCYSVSDTFARLKGIIECQSAERSTPRNTEDEAANSQGMPEDQSGQGSPGNMEDDAGNTQGTTGSQDDGGSQGNRGDEAARKTLLKQGAQLGQDLIEAADDKDEALWAFLAKFWAGFVLHLAQSTRASHHKTYLSTGGELMTHLWVLMSHAGLMGDIAHGEMGTGATPFMEPQRQALDINAP